MWPSRLTPTPVAESVVCIVATPLPDPRPDTHYSPGEVVVQVGGSWHRDALASANVCSRTFERGSICHMHRAAVLSALLLGLVVTTGCWPATQSQTLTAAPTPTTVAGPTAKPTTANGSPATKPAAAAKPTSAPSPNASAAKPAAKLPPASGQASPAPNGTSNASASPPAVVATSVAGLPNVGASPASKPASGDALGVAASANAAAAA